MSLTFRAHRTRARGLAGLLIVAAALVAAPAGARAGSGAAAAATGVTWAQSNADAARSNRDPSETGLTSVTVPGLKPLYALITNRKPAACGGQTNSLPVANPTSLFYFDGSSIVGAKLSTGVQQWRTPALDPTGTSVFVSELSLSGNTLLVGGNDCATTQTGFLTAYDATSGAQLWHLTGTTPISSFVVSGTTIVDAGFATSTPVVEARSVSTGAILWTHKSCDVFDQVVVVGPSVIARCGALGLGNHGKISWKLPAGSFVYRGDPAGTANPQVYIETKDHHDEALSAATGKLIWRSSTTMFEEYAAGPARVFTESSNGDLCALDRATGKLIWRLKVPGLVFVSLASDVVYVGAGYTGSTVVVNATTGALIPLANGSIANGAPSQVSAGRLVTTSQGNISMTVYGLV